MNFARTIALRAGLPYSVAGQTVNRYCSSGLQTIAIAANAIMAGQSEVLVAGGVEFMSSVPMGGNEVTNNPTLQAEEDRKSTRLNSSHVSISYAVFCL